MTKNQGKDKRSNTDNMTPTRSRSRGPVILIEGPDYSGKSSLIDYLKSKVTYRDKDTFVLKEPVSQLKETITTLKTPRLVKTTYLPVGPLPPVPIGHSVHPSPSDTNFSDSQGQIDSSHMDLTRYYLVMSSRSLVYCQVLSHVLDGHLVILDRSFPSTMVYQSSVESLLDINILESNLSLIRAITCDYLHPDDLFPDLVLFLDISLETYLSRMKLRAGKKDDMDLMDPDGITSLFTKYASCAQTLSCHKHFKNKVVTVNMNNPDYTYCQDLISDFLINFSSRTDVK